MYLRKLTVKNFKLLRDVEIDFTKQGEPRLFTVLLGENGLCKTSILQAIAFAASGAERANQLAEVISYPDLRRSNGRLEIGAEFSFSEAYHEHRVYPGLEELDVRPSGPPLLHSRIWIEPGFDLFRGVSTYASKEGLRELTSDHRDLTVGRSSRVRRKRPMDPLGDARGRNLNHWFIAGYGVGRTLPAPASVTPDEIASPSRDRLLSLFKVGRRIVGTGFAELLPKARAESFNEYLQKALVEHKILPPLAKYLSLRGGGSANTALDRVKAHELTLALPEGDIAVPTLWLSQGYQATMAWVADLVGQVWWEAKKQVVPLDQMEGICLVDELDLHLHPRWQANLVSSLKQAFPRMQFIATTHSPMVLPGLTEDEIIRLMLNDAGNVIKTIPEESPALMSGSEIYRKFFGVDRLQPQEIDDALFRYGSLASHSGRSEHEEKEMWKLLDYLRKNDIDPGWNPIPREGVKRMRKRPRSVRKR